MCRNVSIRRNTFNFSDRSLLGNEVQMFSYQSEQSCRLKVQSGSDFASRAGWCNKLYTASSACYSIHYSYSWADIEVEGMGELLAGDIEAQMEGSCLSGHYTTTNPWHPGFQQWGSEP